MNHNSGLVERREDAPYQLQTPLVVPPAGNGLQSKTGYKFHVDSTNEFSTPLDWGGAYLAIDYVVKKKADGLNCAAADNIAVAGDGYSLIRRIDFKWAGKPTTDKNDQSNEVINLSNKFTYSGDYLNEATVTGFYPDSGAPDIATNTAFAIRQKLVVEAATPSLILPLNRYPFIRAAVQRLYPTGKLDIDITLADDNAILFRDGAAADGKVFVTRMELYVPRLTITDMGREAFSEAMDAPQEWTYQQNTTYSSQNLQQSKGTYTIDNLQQRPRIVVVYAADIDVDSVETKNSYHYKTYSVGGDAQPTSVHLTVASNERYPENSYNVASDKPRIYKDFLMMSHKFEDFNKGSFLSKELFEATSPAFVFDLRNQRSDLFKQSVKLELRYVLDKVPANAFQWRAVVFYDQEIGTEVIGNKVELRA